MIKTMFKEPNLKIALMAILLTIVCFLTYYFHVVIGTGIVFGDQVNLQCKKLSVLIWLLQSFQHTPNLAVDIALALAECLLPNSIIHSTQLCPNSG